MNEKQLNQFCKESQLEKQVKDLEVQKKALKKRIENLEKRAIDHGKELNDLRKQLHILDKFVDTLPGGIRRESLEQMIERYNRHFKDEAAIDGLVNAMGIVGLYGYPMPKLTRHERTLLVMAHKARYKWVVRKSHPSGDTMICKRHPVLFGGVMVGRHVDDMVIAWGDVEQELFSHLRADEPYKIKELLKDE